MAGKGIDHARCPKARVRPSLFSGPERAFADVLKRALQKKVVVFLKVRVLDVIELYAEPDRRRLFFWRDVLGDQHFDYVVCRKDTLGAPAGRRTGRPGRPEAVDDRRRNNSGCQQRLLNRLKLERAAALWPLVVRGACQAESAPPSPSQWPRVRRLACDM